MIITPEDMLDLFSIDRARRGAALWVSYAWRICDGEGAAAAVAEVCAEAHMPRAAVYSLMRRTLAPVFSMEPRLWAALGLRPQTTTAGLAREIAANLRREEGRE